MEFANLLADIIVLLLDGNAPVELYHLIREIELVALPKGDNDVRPVGMGMVLRKLATIVLSGYTYDVPTNDGDIQPTSFNASHFQGLQYGCASRATRSIYI